MPKRSTSIRRPLITDWRILPITLDVTILAALFHVTAKTIRNRVRKKTLPVAPFQRNPLLWYKATVQKYFEHLAAVDELTGTES